MYVLYDKDGLLRFVNSDKEACLDYAKLFDLNSKNFSLLDLEESKNKHNVTNLHLNPGGNNN